MKGLNFTTVYIIDPHTKERIPAAEWLAEHADDPIVAQWVAIENRAYGFTLALHKEELASDLNHPDSVAKVEAFPLAGSRLGNRFEWITIYNAIHTAGLNDILASIGGDVIERKWYWTDDLDEDRKYWKTDENGQSHATSAWVYGGAFGGLYTGNGRFVSVASRVVRALDPSRP